MQFAYFHKTGFVRLIFLFLPQKEHVCFVVMQIINRDNVLEGNNETDGYIITSGIIVVLRGAVLPDESIL